MAGLKTASGEDIDGSFELRVEVEEGEPVGQGEAVGQGAAVGQGEAVGQGQPAGPPVAPRVLTLCVTGDLHVGGLLRLIVDTFGEPRDWSDHALWWAQQRRWLLTPGPTLDALGVGGGSRLLFTPRHRPLRLRLPAGGVLRLRLDFAGTPGRAAAMVCGLLGIRHPEELSLLRPERDEGRGGAGAQGPRPHPGPPRPGPDAPESPGRWLDVGRSLLEQGVAEDEELLLRFKYPCAMGLDPQDEPRVALLQEQALGALLAEEIDCSEEQGCSSPPSSTR
ncbi:fermitin family homolog 3-like [Cyanocitta cristata]